jgi:hypothetical protein
MNKLFFYLPALLFIALLSACGAAPPTAKTSGAIKAVIKPSALAVGQNVAGIQLAITVPAGVSPIPASDGPTVEITSPSLQNQDQIQQKVVFTPATATSAGQLLIAGMNVAGFTPSDQITIHLKVAVDSFPVESDFKLLSFEAFDTNGANVIGLNPTLNTTIQF